MDTARKPGWYGQPDLQPGQKRYWDGQAWTEKVSNAPGPAGPGQIALGIVIALAVVGGLVLFLLNVAESASM